MRIQCAILLAMAMIGGAAARPTQPAQQPLQESPQAAQPAEAQQTSVMTAPLVEPPSPTATADELEKRGDLLRVRQRYLDAIDYYEAALKKSSPPATAVLWNKIGIAHIQLQQIGKARKAFDKAIKINREYAEAYNNRGATWYWQKKYGRAINEYKKAIAIKEDSASFHSNMANALFAEKKVPEAFGEFQRALQLDPDILDSRSKAGVILQMANSKDRAEYAFLLARIYAKLGDYDRAFEQLRHAMEDGYKGYDAVYKDADFAALRKDKRFAELMANKPVAIPQ